MHIERFFDLSEIDWVGVIDLIANDFSVWTSYGVATERLAGARAPGDTFTHEADGLIDYIVGTVPVALQAEMSFRIQDADNYWQITVDTVGNIDLDEVVATVLTQRGTAAVGAGDVSGHAWVSFIDEDITIFAKPSNEGRWFTYAFAANFKTETSGKLITEGTGGAITDIVTWPRVLSGDAAAALDTVIGTL